MTAVFHVAVGLLSGWLTIIGLAVWLIVDRGPELDWTEES